MPHIETHIPSDPGTTLVLGGTGKTGRRVARRLAERGVTVRAASRSGHPAFHWNDPTGWDALLADVDAVYISYAPDLAIPGATDAVGAFVARAAHHGVRRLVLLSGRGEAEAQRCEALVQAAGIPWTVVRASWFCQNFSEGEFLPMVRAGAIALPAGAVPEPFVDADDIADVAVAALTETDHTGQVYEVTGPRCLTFAEAAAEISRAAGRPVDFVPLSPADFSAAIAGSGAPAHIAWLLDYLFSTVLDGRNARVCNGVQRALGRPPADFAEFARQAAASGAWTANGELSAEVA